MLDIFTNAQHPYTKGLIACRPTLETRSERLPTIIDFIRAENRGVTLDPTDPKLEIDYAGKATRRREDMPGFGEPLLRLEGLRTLAVEARTSYYGDDRVVKGKTTILARLRRGRAALSRPPR